MPNRKCEVCNIADDDIIAVVHGVPYSAAYCYPCYLAKAQPYHILLQYTWEAGGYSSCAGWWKKMVDTTLTHLDIPKEKFDNDIKNFTIFKD